MAPPVIRSALLGLAALVAWSSLARADDLRAAKRLFARAEAKYRAGAFRAALALYEKAFEAKPLAGFHFNMGQCHRALGQHREAIESFRRYLSESKKTPKHAKEARRLIALSEAELARAPAAPEPAPQPQPEPEPESPPQPPPTRPAAPPPAPAAPAASVPATAGGEPLPVPPRRSSRRHLRPGYFWAGVAVSAALLLTGTVTGALTIQKGNRYNDPSTPHEELRSLRDSGQALKTTSNATFALGAAGAVATTVLFFFTDFRREHHAGSGVAAVPTQGGAMLTLTGAH